MSEKVSGKVMPIADLRSTALITLGALLISVTARGRELVSFSFLLMTWMVVEGFRGQRSWASMGFRRDNFWQELRRNAALIGMVGAVFQAIFWFTARFVYLPLWDQIQGCLASIQTWIPSLFPLLAFITIETLLEEISFRGFIQNRLASHIRVFPAILVGAFFHTGFHWQFHVNVAATIIDLAFMLADNLVYGWIFARSQSIFIAWVAHLSADLISLSLLLSQT